VLDNLILKTANCAAVEVFESLKLESEVVKEVSCHWPRSETPQEGHLAHETRKQRAHNTTQVFDSVLALPKFSPGLFLSD
jgi:hypothetical protein